MIKEILFIEGDPTGLSVPPVNTDGEPIIAYDKDSEEFYQSNDGKSWFKIGSII